MIFYDIYPLDFLRTYSTCHLTFDTAAVIIAAVYTPAAVITAAVIIAAVSAGPLRGRNQLPV